MPTSCVVMDEEASSSGSANDENLAVRFEDVSNEPESPSACGHGDINDPPDEGPESGSYEDTRSAQPQSSVMTAASRSKHATVQEVGDCLPDISFELQKTGTVDSNRVLKSGQLIEHVKTHQTGR